MSKINQQGVIFDVNITGRNSFAVSKAGLPVNAHVIMNNNGTQDSDLRDFIKFGDGGYVKSIEMISNDGVDEVLEEGTPENTYAYRINVRACGPKDGWGYLVFVDRTGDHYSLSLYKHSEDDHYVKYNSTNPDIIAIIWYDDNK